jgi:type III secretion system low calcium response chaperone LcrH/SycD
MKSAPKGLKKVTEQTAKKLEDNTNIDEEEMFRKFNERLKEPRDVLGLTDPVVEGIYAQAYRLYNTGRYKDSIQLFRLLVSLAPTEEKFILGLGACFHLLKEYSDAIDCYTLCASMNTENPIPLYHIADCLIQMNDPVSAKISMDLAIKAAGDKPEFATLRDRAKLTLDSLNARVNEIVKTEE